jgi:hypothetical protein
LFGGQVDNGKYDALLPGEEKDSFLEGVFLWTTVA